MEEWVREKVQPKMIRILRDWQTQTVIHTIVVRLVSS